MKSSNIKRMKIKYQKKKKDEKGEDILRMEDRLL